jgi:16S rRNA processing protein RimM
MAEPLVPLGEIATTHGLAGWLKLNPFNPNMSSLSPGVEVILDKAGERSVHDLEAISPHKHQFLIKLRNLKNIDDAAPYVGATLAVSESSLQALEPSEYYHYQVIGFEVFDTKGERIGKITSMMMTPGGALYAVQGENKEHLIPAVKEIIERVDFTADKMIIDPPDGLLDL